jgi:hypothetical protein
MISNQIGDGGAQGGAVTVAKSTEPSDKGRNRTSIDPQTSRAVFHPPVPTSVSSVPLVEPYASSHTLLTRPGERHGLLSSKG